MRLVCYNTDSQNRNQSISLGTAIRITQAHSLKEEKLVKAIEAPSRSSRLEKMVINHKDTILLVFNLGTGSENH